MTTEEITEFVKKIARCIDETVGETDLFVESVRVSPLSIEATIVERKTMLKITVELERHQTVSGLSEYTIK